MKIKKWLVVVASISVLLVVGGCSLSRGDKQIRYYHFDTSISTQSIDTNAVKGMIELEEISMPTFLNGRNIVLRTDSHQLVAANWHLWAEQPDSMLTQSAVQLLSKAFPDIAVQAVSANTPLNSEHHWLLKIELSRFNGGVANDVELAGQWSLLKRQQNGSTKVLLLERFVLTEKLQDQGYAELVKALQLSWHMLIKDVAERSQAKINASAMHD